MKRTPWLVLALIFVPGIAFAKRHTPVPPAPVVVAKPIEVTEVFDSLIYPARVISRVNAVVLAESDGVVQKIHKPLGSRVRGGEAVLTLVNPDPVYTFAPFNVLSPVTGVISAVDVTIGSRVAKGQKLGTVTDPSQVIAAIEVTVADLDAIRVGMEAELVLGDGLKPSTARVSGISPLVDPATGTATAELTVDKGKLPPPGIVGRVRFRARLHQGIQIPESAVFYRGEAPLVRVIDGEKATFRSVKLGTSRQGKFEILEGLKAGEKLVLRTNTFIADGEKVSEQKADGDGA